MAPIRIRCEQKNKKPSRNFRVGEKTKKELKKKERGKRVKQKGRRGGI